MTERVVPPARGLGVRTRMVAWGALLVTMTAVSGFFGAVTFARVSRAMDEALRGDRDTSLIVGHWVSFSSVSSSGDRFASQMIG